MKILEVLIRRDLMKIDAATYTFCRELVSMLPRTGCHQLWCTLTTLTHDSRDLKTFREGCLSLQAILESTETSSKPTRLGPSSPVQKSPSIRITTFQV